MQFRSTAPNMRSLAIAALAMVAGAATLRSQTWGQYGVTVYLPPTEFLQAFIGVNNSGQVAGMIGGAGAIFSAGSGTAVLPHLSGSGLGYATGINNVGQAVGREGLHEALWSTGTVQDLGALGRTSEARAINDAGQVVGYSMAGRASSTAFLWSNDDRWDLGTLGGTRSVANGINEYGQVVGSSSNRAGQTHAFIWGGELMRDLGTLGGSFSSAVAINEAGQVVGGSHLTGDTQSHSFLWSDGVMQDLGTLGGDLSTARGVSDDATVVGLAQDANAIFRAAIWETNGSAHTAFSLADIVNDGVTNTGWIFGDATGISENGRWISASGYNAQTGYLGTVVLEANAMPLATTATPEPATLTLLGTGMAAIGGAVRRRRRNASAT